MTKLTYKVTMKNGSTVEINNLPDTKAFIAENGGTYEPIYKTVRERGKINRSPKAQALVDEYGFLPPKGSLLNP